MLPSWCYCMCLYVYLRMVGFFFVCVLFHLRFVHCCPVHPSTHPSLFQRTVFFFLLLCCFHAHNVLRPGSFFYLIKNGHIPALGMVVRYGSNITEPSAGPFQFDPKLILPVKHSLLSCARLSECERANLRFCMACACTLLLLLHPLQIWLVWHVTHFPQTHRHSERE